MYNGKEVGEEFTKYNPKTNEVCITVYERHIIQD